ncbi:MAG: FKBP-type peptidyl-prolyl cis-trans isomerase [Clostridia bacterium]|nr:FKBP-type peptidyl-prolyl cis-trans isomerase [Clostridia bacterium]
MSENVKNTKTENAQVKRLSEKNLAVIITAALLAVIFIAAAIVMLVDAVQKDYGFDYIKSNLSDYIEFTEDYKNFKVEVDIAKPHDIDVDVALLNIIYADREVNKKYQGATITSAYTISAGDTVNIWYRGYLLDDEGNKIEVDGMSNFPDSAPYSLGIGSGSFIPGFELNLIGINTGDYNKFEKITTGAVEENQIAYITYSVPSKTDSTKNDTFKNIRVDLSTDLDAKYGVGFKEKLLEFNVGEKKDIAVNLDDKALTYTNLTVNFVTECESNPIVVETYFNYNYQQADLRNETAYFEVYVEGLVDYECPEFNDEYLKKLIEDKKISISLDNLNEYEGETLVEKYRDYVQTNLDELYEASYEQLVKSEILEHYSNIAKGKKFPGYIIDEIYESYLDELRLRYISSGGNVQNMSTGQYTTYDTLEKYIPAFLGLPASQNWQTYVTNIAMNTALERMAMFYILKAENLLPTDAELDAKVAELRQEFIDEYVNQYMANEGKSKDDYTDEEYADIVAEGERDTDFYMSEEYFVMRAYNDIFTDIAMEWVEVSTLDDRRAYPLDK